MNQVCCLRYRADKRTILYEIGLDFEGLCGTPLIKFPVSAHPPHPPPPPPEVCVNKVVIFFIMEATYTFPLLQRLHETFHHVVYLRGHLHTTLHPHAKVIQFNCKSCAHLPLLQKLQVTLHQVYMSSGLSEQ